MIANLLFNIKSTCIHQSPVFKEDCILLLDRPFKTGLAVLSYSAFFLKHLSPVYRKTIGLLTLVFTDIHPFMARDYIPDVLTILFPWAISRQCSGLFTMVKSGYHINSKAIFKYISLLIPPLVQCYSIHFFELC